jgi:hypothetical protein
MAETGMPRQEVRKICDVCPTWRRLLAAGAGIPGYAESGGTLILELPAVPVRSLADYAIGSPS